jgi:hypothetical protein
VDAGNRAGKSGAKFRGVRQVLKSPSKQEFAVTYGRMGARAADGACLRLKQDKWK